MAREFGRHQLRDFSTSLSKSKSLKLLKITQSQPATISISSFTRQSTKMPRNWDDERLPHGLTIIGRDETEDVWYAEDEDGSHWVSSRGTKYGSWTQTSGPTKERPQPPSRSQSQTANSQGSASDPRRFETFLGPESLDVKPSVSRSSSSSSIRKALANTAKKAVSGVKRVSSIKSTRSKAKSPLSRPPQGANEGGA